PTLLFTLFSFCSSVVPLHLPSFPTRRSSDLVIGSGLFVEWFESDEALQFGPTLTPWGAVTVTIAHPRVEPTLRIDAQWRGAPPRSEEHTSELQSRENLVCRLLLEKKKKDTEA